MAHIYGKKWTKRELLSIIGDTQQIAGAKPFEYIEGKAKGVTGIRVNTGSGFQFTVLPGRGMDIPEANFCGKPLCFFSGTGVTSPAYFEEQEFGWLRSFYGGLLTSCGMENTGPPTIDNGESYGLHGRISNAAAENLCVDQRWDGDEFIITLKGMMREAKALQFETFTLTRTIETALGRKNFRLNDVIENHGFKPQPLMLLYHFNFGFPLLSPTARIVGPVIESVPRDEEARKNRGVEECLAFPEPQQGYHEKVFFHRLASEPDGATFIALVNENSGDDMPLGAVLRFNKNELPAFTQWKMPGKGFYVLGLEPGTGEPLGRSELRKMNKLLHLNGQEQYSITIDFEVLESMEEIDTIEKEADRLKNIQVNNK